MHTAVDSEAWTNKMQDFAMLGFLAQLHTELYTWTMDVDITFIVYYILHDTGVDN